MCACITVGARHRVRSSPVRPMSPHAFEGDPVSPVLFGALSSWRCWLGAVGLVSLKSWPGSRWPDEVENLPSKEGVALLQQRHHGGFRHAAGVPDRVLDVPSGSRCSAARLVSSGTFITSPAPGWRGALGHPCGVPAAGSARRCACSEEKQHPRHLRAGSVCGAGVHNIARCPATTASSRRAALLPRSWQATALLGTTTALRSWLLFVASMLLFNSLFWRKRIVRLYKES